MIPKMKNFIKDLPFAAGVARKIRNLKGEQVSKRHIKRLLRDREEIFLEVGAGNKKGENGWTSDRCYKGV